MALCLPPISNGSCPSKDGGLIRSAAVLASEITAVTTATVGGATQITGFTMASAGLWALYEYSYTGAQYNQVGSRNNDLFSVEQTATLNFDGVSPALSDAACKASGCCDVVMVHEFSNGAIVVQGIELSATNAAGFVRTKKAQTYITASVNSNTSDAKSVTSFEVKGTASCFSPHTTLTIDDLLAL